jgi:TonB family protein
MPRTISMRIWKHEQLVASRSFSQAVIKIGKLRSSDLHLEDDTIARMHAVLEVTPNDIRLIDLGSAAGTSLNHHRVSKNAAVANGDSLSIGPFRLELYASASPRAALPIDVRDVEQPEHPVAEVVAHYGNTVLDVQHVGQVRSRRRQAPAFLALGGLMLLAGAGIMAHEVSQDWAGHQEASTQALAAGRPAPQAPGMGLGGLGMSLALLGLVPLGLGAMRRQDIGLDRYTLGEGHDASFPTAAEGLPEGDAFPLVSKHGDGEFLLRFTPHMRGHVSIGGQRHALDELVRAGRVGVAGSAYALALPPGATAHIEHGAVAYDVAAVAGGKAIARATEADKPFWIYNATSGAVLGGLLALVHLVPEDALHMSMDELIAENRYVGYMQQPDDQKEPEVAQVAEVADQEESGGTGKRHKHTEGKMGDPKAKTPTGIYAMKGPKHAPPSMARNFDAEMEARNAGILGALQNTSGHILSSPYGGAFAVGNDDADIWGGKTGTDIGAAFGVGGIGLAGIGRGGGGTGEGTISLGNIGTIGKSGGGGDGIGYGRGNGSTRFKERGPRVPQIRPGKPVVKGTIDKDIIRQIIRNHHNEVRHCYNQGLTRDPNLQGRVAVMFTIGPAGTVPSAAVSENTLGDHNVGTCVAGAVRRWKFPKPATGGTAMVTYPFAFSPG